MEKGKNTENGLFDADDFWSLDSLLPPNEKKKPTNMVSNPAVSLHDFEIEGDALHQGGEKIPKREENSYLPITDTGEKISFEKWLEGRREFEKNRSAYGKRTVLEYSLSGRYVKKVTVSEETGRRAGGERFISDGQRILGITGEFKKNVPLESFYPQYSQLTQEQLKCYIGFRTEVQKGRFPDVSRAYVYLYLYELINFSVPSPSERAQTVASLINGYPECDERLFCDMCNWLADMCLIYQLDIPKSIYGGNLSRVIECAKIKEVFLEGQDSLKMPLMISASGYDYKKSRFYPQFSKYYDRYIPWAVSEEIKKLSETDSRYSEDAAEYCVMSHESYFGAFCASAMRRTVSVEVRCTTKDETVKKTVSDMVKYAENRLRAMLMIKPRLTVIYLPISVRDGIKAFFRDRAALFPRRNEKPVKKEVFEIPEYEKYYEPAETGISEEAAKEIEKTSWQITDRLVCGLEGTENAYTAPTDTNEQRDMSENVFCKSTNVWGTEKSTEESVFTSQCGKGSPLTLSEHQNKTGASVIKPGQKAEENTLPPSMLADNKDDIFISALDTLLRGDEEGFKALAKKKGMLVSAFADFINELAYDEIGDTVVAEAQDGFFIIDDYIDDVREIVSGRHEND